MNPTVKKIKSGVLALLLVSILIVSTFKTMGQSVSPNKDKGKTDQGIEADVLSCLTREFGRIVSLSAEIDSEIHTEPGFPGSDSKSVSKTKFNYFQKGSNYYYELYNTSTGVEELLLKHARLDDLDQYFTPGLGGYLQLSKTRSDRLDLSTDNVLLLPFSFLYPNQKEKASFILMNPGLDDLRNPVVWKELASVELLNTTSDTVTLKFTQTGGTETRLISSKYTFEVTFSKMFQWFPIRFIKKAANGVTVATYTCNETGELRGDSPLAYDFTYPKTVTCQGFSQTGVLLYTRTCTLSHVEVNKIDDDSIFTIDPSSAHLIYDVDKNAYITVPR